MRRSITVDFVLPFVMNRHGIILEWVRGLFVGLSMGFAARHQSRCEVCLFFYVSFPGTKLCTYHACIYWFISILA